LAENPSRGSAQLPVGFFEIEARGKAEYFLDRRWDMNPKVILEPSDEGDFTAIVPSLPGCISE
jgi:hypothetical protein